MGGKTALTPAGGVPNCSEPRILTGLPHWRGAGNSPRHKTYHRYQEGFASCHRGNGRNASFKFMHIEPTEVMKDQIKLDPFRSAVLR